MGSLACAGHLVMVDGHCEPACPMSEIKVVGGIELKWNCTKLDGSSYSKNDTYILKGDTCNLVCPLGLGAVSHNQTMCKSGGEFENKNEFRCKEGCGADKTG